MKKKQVMTILLAAMMAVGTITGCGTASGSKEEVSSGNASKISGTIDEIKDFMFVIKTGDGTYYSFPRNEEDGVDLSDLQVGDEIVLEYEGTLSEIDAFTGTLISIEKEE